MKTHCFGRDTAVVVSRPKFV
uniref:Uncharacterized protein n=1 Tax=Arundo donax TaxID=35708 RepID=A0A0A9CHC6_ARUDO